MSARGASRSPPSGALNASSESRLRSVNSQPGRPLKVGSSSAVTSANGALHLELDEAVHLHRVLHRQLLDDRLDEAVDDQLAGLLLGHPARHQVEELLLADLGDAGLMADGPAVLPVPDR